MKRLLSIILLIPSMTFCAKPFDEWARPGVFCKLLEQSLPQPTAELPATDFIGNVGSNIAMNIAVSIGMGVVTLTGKMLFKGGEIALNHVAEVLKDNNGQATVNININAPEPQSSYNSVDNLVENMSYDQLVMLADTEGSRPESSQFWREKLYNRRVQMKLIDPSEY